MIAARSLLIALGLAALGVSPTVAADAPRTQDGKPNIVILYADDLGYGDVHCYNPDRGKIPTPCIDRLAAEGIRFTDAHSSSGVCSPSRYTLLTGRYHWRSRLQRGIVGQWEEPLIAAERLTLGTLAKEHGYNTACIGKWHLGWDWPIPPDQRAAFTAKKPADAATEERQRALWATVFAEPIAAGPTTRGFELYFGTDVPNWPPFCFIEGDRTVGIPTERLKGGPGLEGWTFEPILPTLADRACAFIEEQARQGDSFLLYMPLTSPHTPIVPNAEWQGKSGLNAYADFVMETDAAVGRVMAALERSGVADRTLVVFSSDNGCAPAANIDALERQGHFPSGPLRGYKEDAYEGGHRVPFIVRWPGVVVAGTTCDALVHQADLLRTFAEILHAPLPETAGEDSVSLLPLFRGDARPVREHAVSASSRGVPALRSGSWKYIPASGSGGWSEGGDRAQPVQLYDLSTDVGETTNLASAQPKKLATMQDLLEELIVAGRSTPGAPQQNDVKVVRYPAAAEPKRTDRKFSARESESRLRAEGNGWGLEKARIADASRPRVLLIGDSILGGYQKHVIAALDGKAYVDVWQNPHCQSEKTNQVLAEVLDEGPYDVVHANMGLHGWPEGRIKEGTFEPLTRAYIDVIRTKLPKAKIIWANSTPVRTKNKPGELDPVINANILAQNRMSAKVMEEMHMPVNDFYSLLEKRLDLAKTDQFHWTPPAYEILGEAAARSISAALPADQAAARPPTVCNPLDLPYRFELIPGKNGSSFRTAADPSAGETNRLQRRTLRADAPGTQWDTYADGVFVSERPLRPFCDVVALE
jgi:arylsulfatase A